MVQIVLIGIGAGAASALLFATVASGSLLSILLFYLAPLPIMIAALGWSHFAGLIGAIGAAVALGVVFGHLFFFAYLGGAGAPAWLLAYLAMLARPGANGSQKTLEWYPPGRLVVWSAVLATLIVVVAVPNFGTDEEGFRAGLKNALERLIRAQGATAASPPPNTERLIDFLVSAIPPAAAVLATITNVFNLWLAGRVVKFSGRLPRPWPALPSLEFPRIVTVAFTAALLASFISGLAGILAGVLAAALLTAYGILGFAVLHTVTRAMPSRPFVLVGAYTAVIVFGWPILVLCVLGLIEVAFNLRARFNRKHGPPAPT